MHTVTVTCSEASKSLNNNAAGKLMTVWQVMGLCELQIAEAAKYNSASQQKLLSICNGNARCGELTLRLLVETIPLHFAASNITADKVLAIAKEDPVTYCVNVRRREICDSSVASVFAVGWALWPYKLLPDLQGKRTYPCQWLCSFRFNAKVNAAQQVCMWLVCIKKAKMLNTDRCLKGRNPWDLHSRLKNTIN